MPLNDIEREGAELMCNEARVTMRGEQTVGKHGVWSSLQPRRPVVFSISKLAVAHKHKHTAAQHTTSQRTKDIVNIDTASPAHNDGADVSRQDKSIERAPTHHLDIDNHVRWAIGVRASCGVQLFRAGTDIIRCIVL